MDRDRGQIFAMMAAAVLLPLLLFGALQGAFLMRSVQDSVEADAIYRARTVNAAIDGLVLEDLSALKVLASSQFLVTQDFAGAKQRVTAVQNVRPRWKSVYLTDALTDQVIWSTSDPAAAGTPAPAWIMRWEDGGRRSSIGELVREGPGCPCMTIHVPVGENGRVRYQLSAMLGTSDVQAALMAHTEPKTISAVVDGQGRFIARSKDSEARAGTPATTYVRQAISKGTSGTYPGVTFEGFRNFTAFETSPLTGWSTHMAIGENLLLGPERASLFLTGGAAASAIALALLMGLFVWKQLEARRIQAARVAQSDKLNAVGELASGLSHDLNNLLTVITTSAEFLKRPDLAENRRLRYINAISDAAERASGLTGQLLAFARRQPLRPQVFDVGEQIRRTGNLIRPMVGERIVVSLDLPEKPCFALADLDQFQAALLNLCTNARDAMDRSGRLELKVAEAKAIPAVRGQPARAGQFVVVTAQDTGIGIEPSRLDRIFEPFVTSKEVGKGTGLGLSQVVGFAHQSGGEVTVESDPGAGATFRLFLPAQVGGAIEPPAAPAASTPLVISDTVRILVVEDNETVGQYSTELLHDLGFKTTWVADAEEALSLLSTNAERFDLVISDIIMPGRTGIELAKEIRQSHPKLPVVLASGYTGTVSASDLGGFSLLKKPYTVDELSAAIAKALSGKR